jgi:hypothetical protein
MAGNVLERRAVFRVVAMAHVGRRSERLTTVAPLLAAAMLLLLADCWR